MAKVLLRCSAKLSRGECALCRKDVTAPPGAQLCTDTDGLVCEACGRKHAPELLALIRLGDTAERVGRIGSFGICPPMIALLELARAAEDYTRHVTPPPLRKAA
jgi:hypothetical protein